MIRRILAFIGMALLAPAVFAADKPNVVYILVDNWGWGDISAQGAHYKPRTSISLRAKVFG